MTILPDGRWKLSGPEINNKVWLYIKGWRLENPDKPTHMIPSFPVCNRRSLKVTCKPCGKISALNYWCDLKQTFVSVKFCDGCVARGENEQLPSNATESVIK